MQNVLITGSNRGIGLALTTAYLGRGDRVFAACRNPARASDLQALADTHGSQLVILPLEVGELDSIRAAVALIKEHTDTIDILINNAGINAPQEDQRLDYIDFATMTRLFRVNSFAPLMIAQQCLTLLRRSHHPKVINLSSEMGSIAETDYGGWYAYCGSKAALNMISRLLANELSRYNVIVAPVDPGWVQTDMGGEDAELAPEDSAAGLVALIDGMTPIDSGKFWRWDGSQYPW
ncbi:MAG: SDR family oxidoreductase [Anaerolineae bacterium]|nr:SDR family oxidoreductase [Anaerolineae bacterium]